MKFSKLLKRKAEEFQESGLGEHFLRYKALKQILKKKGGPKEAAEDKDIGHAFQSLEDASTNLQTGEEQHIPSQAVSETLTLEELSFIDMVKEDLDHFNDFFIEKEEECIIRTQALTEQLPKAEGDRNFSSRLRSAFVDLHGEMVLLLHWSMLNYTAVVKILKKHDKQSGVVLRAPFLTSVLQQPFYSTERITSLVREVEQHLETLHGDDQDADRREGNAEGSPSARGSSPQAHLLMRTQAALDMWQEMGAKASTPSTVLLGGKRPKLGEAAPDLAAQQQQRGSLDREAVSPPEVEAK